MLSTLLKASPEVHSIPPKYDRYFLLLRWCPSPLLLATTATYTSGHEAAWSKSSPALSCWDLHRS